MVEIALSLKAAPIGLPSAIETGTRPMGKSDLNAIDRHVGSRVRMRRLMLDMSQTEVAEALGLTLQHVQKYEKGMGRLGASRLQHLSQILRVPVAFFFAGLPDGPGMAESATRAVESLSDVNQFVATPEGLALAKSFSRIQAPKLRHSIFLLVQQIASRAT
jgi:transcriptional regulator with XRE-family HTH domain